VWSCRCSCFVSRRGFIVLDCAEMASSGLILYTFHIWHKFGEGRVRLYRCCERRATRDTWDPLSNRCVRSAGDMRKNTSHTGNNKNRSSCLCISSSKWVLLLFKGDLRRKMKLWSNYTLLPSQPLSEICFHDCRM